jgi:hypothetical protein
LLDKTQIIKGLEWSLAKTNELDGWMEKLRKEKLSGRLFEDKGKSSFSKKSLLYQFYDRQMKLGKVFKSILLSFVLGVPLIGTIIGSGGIFGFIMISIPVWIVSVPIHSVFKRIDFHLRKSEVQEIFNLSQKDYQEGKHKIFEEIIALEEELEAHSPLPRGYWNYDACSTIKRYFESYRVDTMKEAINLYESESNQEAFQDEVLESLEHQTNEVRTQLAKQNQLIEKQNRELENIKTRQPYRY